MIEIKNYRQIGTTRERRHALDIIQAGIHEVEPRELLYVNLKYDQDFNSIEVHNQTFFLLKGRIFVVGAGKAAGNMARAVERIIGPDNITAGIVNCQRTDFDTDKIKVHRAGHPIPDKHGQRGAEKMLGLKEEHDIGPKDLVLCLISGGGSAQMPLPAGSIRIDDMQLTTRLLIESGAEIHEINAVRKHISLIAGGQLGQHFQPAQVVSLVLSDVIGDPLDVVASGPTVPDNTTFVTARQVLKKYHLWKRVPRPVREYLEAGARGKAGETPKHLENCHNFIIGNNSMALEAMSHKARNLGYSPLIVRNDLAGDPNKAAAAVAKQIMGRRWAGYNALMFGHETTPTLPPEHGEGGRNMHFVAASALNLIKLRQRYTLASVCTDGRDFLERAAGAIVDDETYGRAKLKEIDYQDYLRRYDTYNLFEALGENLIITGDTGTNVRDTAVYLLHEFKI